MAWLLSLLEDPPPHLFVQRGRSENPRLRDTPKPPRRPAGQSILLQDRPSSGPLVPSQRLGQQSFYLAASMQMSRSVPGPIGLMPRQHLDPDRNGSAKPAQICFRACGLGLLPVSFVQGLLLHHFLNLLRTCERGCVTPSHALFPMLVPFDGVFDHVPPHKASRVRSRLATRRVCHVLHHHFRLPPLRLLQRRPNEAQARVFP